MAFTNGKYEADSGLIHPIRMDSLRYAAAGTPPNGESSSSIKAEIGKSNREFGLRPRGVTLGRTLGTAPDTFVRYSFLPVLRAADFVDATFAAGATITIDSVVWTIISKQNEDF